MAAKILHISDIHFSKHSEGSLDPDAPYRDALIEIVRASAKSAAFDCIFLTGDVAGRGAVAEYAVAEKWLDDLLKLAGCGRDGVFIVPGNHDVDRTVTRDVAIVRMAQAAVTGAKTDRDRESELVRAMDDPDVGPALFRSLQNYNEFATKFRSEIGPGEYGSWTRQLVLDHGYGLKIFGLTSVLFSSCSPPGGDDQRARNLYVGPMQQTLRSRPGEIVATLVHHPADWLLDSTLQARALTNRSMLHFEGHVHDRQVHRDARHMRFSAGAVNPNRHEHGFEPGFNIVSLNVAADARGVYHLNVEAEVWAWQENPSRFRLHQDPLGNDRWTHSMPLIPIPEGEEPMVAADRAPPPAPVETAGIGPAIQRFWALPGSAKARIADLLGLLTEDERRLPERYRFNNMFRRAAAQNKTDELISAIRAEGENQ